MSTIVNPRAPTTRTRPVVLALTVWAGVVVVGAGALVAVGDLDATGTRFPPLHARWDPRPGPWVMVVVVGAALAVWRLPGSCARGSWRAALWRASLAAFGWGLALALVDGTNGLVGPARSSREYLAGVSGIGSPSSFLREFPGNILDFPVHVQGHPPGYPIVVWTIDRLGLGAWGVTALQVAGGVLAVPAVLVAVRALGGERFARAAAPFVAMSPAAIWLVSSADAVFAGVGAWAVACLVLACTRAPDRRADALALVGGVGLGVAAFLSYGLVLLAVVPAVVAWRTGRIRLLVLGAGGACVVLAAFALGGFWWFSGLAATRGRYEAGIASRRPFEVFLVANLACIAVATGPAVAAGLSRLRAVGPWLLVGGALGAIAVADVSGMSKGEVERIWLPFAVWLLPAAAAVVLIRDPGGADVFDERSARRWLAMQCGLALLVQALVRTPW